jgi:NADH-quinone oxidoreductase subunit L
MSPSTQHLILWLIPLAPLVSALLTTLLGPCVLKGKSHLFCWLALAVSFVCSLIVLINIVPAGFQLHDSKAIVAPGYDWLSAGGLHVQMNLRADAITGIMLAMVTGVSLLVSMFASGYMHDDPGYPRFFAEVSLFVFSMCMLVLSSSFLMLFVFWEAVGLCSYLLIGFWFAKPSASAAAKKAFVVNRIGDFGFLLGIFLIWATFGSLEFSDVLGNSEQLRLLAQTMPDRMTIICLLLFLGAVGKSAQFPLQVWLPDAMEGPTPVSALIHAATMVTAGVYMVARCTPLFVLSPTAQMTVSAIGAITALIAALTALTQYDLKQVLAYSTVSQLGYMFMALGAGGGGLEIATLAVTAGMFHLFTHAFFKALLFLSAGSVMHSMGNIIDMREFSGLRKILPITHWTFLCGAAALAGFPLLAGFWSKDEILTVLTLASEHGPHKMFYAVILWIATAAAVLTAFYTFRAYFLTFWGPEKFPEAAGHHPHDAPPIMAWPLRILAVCAVGIGAALGPTHLFGEYLHHAGGLPHSPEHGIRIGVVISGSIAALVGIAVAWFFYLRSPAIPARLAGILGPLYQLSLNKFYLDQILWGLVVGPFRALAVLATLFDIGIIDGIVDGLGKLPRVFSVFPRVLQNGLVPSYALVMLTGVLCGLWFVLGNW